MQQKLDSIRAKLDSVVLYTSQRLEAQRLGQQIQARRLQLDAAFAEATQKERALADTRLRLSTELLALTNLKTQIDSLGSELRARVIASINVPRPLPASHHHSHDSRVPQSMHPSPHHRSAAVTDSHSFQSSHRHSHDGAGSLGVNRFSERLVNDLKMRLASLQLARGQKSQLIANLETEIRMQESAIGALRSQNNEGLIHRLTVEQAALERAADSLALNIAPEFREKILGPTCNPFLNQEEFVRRRDENDRVYAEQQRKCSALRVELDLVTRERNGAQARIAAVAKRAQHLSLWRQAQETGACDVTFDGCLSSEQANNYRREQQAQTRLFPDHRERLRLRIHDYANAEYFARSIESAASSGAVSPFPPQVSVALARLFELVRQQELAASQSTEATALYKRVLREFEASLEAELTGFDQEFNSHKIFIQRMQEEEKTRIAALEFDTGNRGTYLTALRARRSEKEVEKQTMLTQRDEAAAQCARDIAQLPSRLIWKVVKILGMDAVVFSVAFVISVVFIPMPLSFWVFFVIGLCLGSLAVGVVKHSTGGERQQLTSQLERRQADYLTRIQTLDNEIDDISRKIAETQPVVEREISEARQKVSEQSCQLQRTGIETRQRLFFDRAISQSESNHGARGTQVTGMTLLALAAAQQNRQLEQIEGEIADLAPSL
jgi:hypothetical protein